MMHAGIGSLDIAIASSGNAQNKRESSALGANPWTGYEK
jgi:hypothetical protein